MNRPFTRRRLLQASGLSTVALAGALVLGRLLGGGRPVPAGVRLRVLGAKEYGVLQAIARRVLDGAEPRVGSGPGEVDVAAFADGYLATLHESLRGDVRGLLQLMEHGSSLRGRFSELDAAAQDEILRGFMDSGLALRRQGFQALKSLCCLAYYQDPRTFASIRYSGPLVPPRW